MTALDRPGYELVTVLDAPHDLRAVLYRRAKPQPPDSPLAGDPPPWQQDELPAGLEERPDLLPDGWTHEMVQRRDEALARLTPSQRRALGLPDGSGAA